MQPVGPAVAGAGIVTAITSRKMLGPIRAPMLVLFCVGGLYVR